MTTEISKRALTAGLTAGLGAGALALLAQTQRAAADTPFSNFAFPTTGSPTARTMPDRLNEIKNVKDFGALGDGVTDDTAAIQAAVNWNSGANRGVIFFPPGVYKVTSPITFNYGGELSIIFRGVAGLSKIGGNFNGYLLDRLGDVPTGPTSGTRIVETLWFENGHPTGGAVRIQRSIGVKVRDCRFSANRCLDMYNCQSWSIETCTFTTGGNYAGSFAIECGENGSVKECDITGFQTGLMFRGVGTGIYGCRFEVNGTGIACGASVNSDVSGLYANGFTIIGGSFESNGTAIDFLYGCGNFIMGGFQIIGFQGAAPGGGNPQYGLRLRSDKCQSGSITGVSCGVQAQVAGISIENTTNRGGLIFMGVGASNTSTLGGVAWTLPTAAHTAEFINCGVNPTYLFAGLPTGINLRVSDKYYITDGNQTTIGGNVTAGGGTNKSWVTWDGANWKRAV